MEKKLFKRSLTKDEIKAWKMTGYKLKQTYIH